MNRDLIRYNEQFIITEANRLKAYGLLSDDIRQYLEHCYQNDQLVNTEYLVSLINEYIQHNEDTIIEHLKKGG